MRHSLVTLTLNPAIDISGAIEKLVPSHKLRCGNIKREPGGGGINVARVLQRLGGTPLAVFPAGGATGAQLSRMLAAQAVNHVAIAVTAEVRENLVVQEKSGAQYRFVFPGPALTSTEIETCAKTALEAVAPGGWLVASGSLPPGAASDSYHMLAMQAAALGVQLALDTSGEALCAGVGKGIALLKVNEDELEELSGKSCSDEASCIAAAIALLEQGPAMIAVTRGEKGALLIGQDFAFKGLAPPIAPASTVGAGDSFLAALVWALSKNRPHPEALRQAIAAGCAALLATGTELAHAEAISDLAPRVEIQALVRPPAFHPPPV
jgi:6-phosphofructokinase 2